MFFKKEKRCFTIMVVPHSEEATYSMRFPLYAVQGIVIALIMGIAGFGILGYSYLKAAAEAQEVVQLKQINQAQQDEIDALAFTTQQTMNQINELDKVIENVLAKIEEVEIPDNIAEVELIKDDSEEEQISSNAANSTNAFLYSIEALTYPNSYMLPGIGAINGYNINQGLSTSGRVLDRAIENITALHSIIPEHMGTLDEVDEYIDIIEAKLEQLELKPSLWPARGRLTSGFGTRRIPYGSGYQFHTGVDIAGSYGSTIRATAKGRVIYSGYRGSLGNLLIIDHGHGYKTYYAHLANFSVRRGDEVEKGQTIGSMGASGRTTGTHLHYEVHYNGTPVNPIRYMEAH